MSTTAFMRPRFFAPTPLLSVSLSSFGLNVGSKATSEGLLTPRIRSLKYK